MWANMPITQVGGLPYLDYLRFRRDYFITRLSQTDEGEDYLARAWRLSRTEPDREAARAAFG